MYPALAKNGYSAADSTKSDPRFERSPALVPTFKSTSGGRGSSRSLYFIISSTCDLTFDRLRCPQLMQSIKAEPIVANCRAERIL
jgi:hypothetical protein